MADREGRDRAYGDGRPPERRHPVFNLLLLALAIAIACFLSAPYFAFRSLRAAAQYRDAAEVARLVDFRAVRAALAVDLGPEPAQAGAEPPSVWRDPIGAMRHALTPVVPQSPRPAVDRYLTLDGLSALTRGYAPGAAPPRPSAPGLAERARTLANPPWPQYRYWDPNRVRIAVRRPGEPSKSTLFTFERRGWFSWTLVQIGLPQD